VKVSLCFDIYTMKVESGGKALRVLNFGSRETSAVRFMLRPVSLRYPMGRRLGGLECPSEHRYRREKILSKEDLCRSKFKIEHCV
jgi:hypothetical protein